MNDLEWIARKVNKPDRRMKYARSNTDHMAVLVSPIKYKDSLPFLNEFFGGEEVIAERARLQNKPDWSTAPDWAEWLAQDGDDGGWYWYEEKPCANSREFISAYMIDTAGKKGEILGDFRDALEPRPEEQTMTKKEWRGPKDGLPPVGSCVEYFDAVQEVWQKQYIVAHHVCGEQAIFSESIDGGDLYYGVPTDFRPIQTEEDRAVEDMVNIITKTYTDSKSELPSELPHRDSLEVYLREIYRAGYHKQEPFE